MLWTFPPVQQETHILIQADMSAPHQTSLCEFCALGICQHGQQNDIDSIASQFEHLDVDDDYDNVSDEDYDDVSDHDYDQYDVYHNY
jgi:hypothetical protein